MNALLRLAPLALVVALGIVLAGRTVPAGATPTSLTVNGSSSASSVTLNTAVPVVATWADEGTGNFTLYSTAAASVGYFLTGPTLTQNNDAQTITPNAVSQATSIIVTDDADATAEATSLQAFFFCAGTGTSQIYYTQAGGASNQIAVTCGSAASTVSVSPASAVVGGAATVTGTCTAAGQTLVSTTGGYFTTSPSNGTYISTQQVNCIAAGTVTATFYCSSTATVTFTLNGATAYLYCGSGSGGITVSPSTVALNGAASVTGTCTAAGQPLVATGGGGYFTTTASNGTYVSATQINCVAAGSVVATFYCSGNATVTFTLNGTTGTLYCGSTSGTVAVNPATGTATTITGTCTAGALLTQTGPASITSAMLNGQYVTTGIAAGSVSCATSGTLTATLTCNSAGNVYVSLGGGSATFVCSAGTGYNPYSGYNPYNQNPYGTNSNCGYSVSYCPPSAAVGATSLSVSASSSSVSCGGSSAITVAVKGANGAAAADGTTVLLSSTTGTVSPTTATTSGGSVQGLFSAPSSGNASASISASAGSATGSTSVSVACAPVASLPAVAPPAPPVASVSAATAVPFVISPPNTGDAGLKVNDGDPCIDAAVSAP